MARFVSVFDLDHTLLKINSSHRFGLFLFRRKVIPLFSLLYCLTCYYQHKIFGLSLEILHDKVFDKIFSGAHFETLLQHMNDFVDLYFEDMCYEPAVKRLKNAQKNNHYVVILSNSPDFVVGPIAKRFNVDEWRSSHYEVDEKGCLTHVITLLEGANKASYVEKLIKKFKISIDNVTAYSDSYLDIPLLESVGVAVAVNPDKHLKLHCKKENWEII